MYNTHDRQESALKNMALLQKLLFSVIKAADCADQ
jgi:hypothetical protein